MPRPPFDPELQTALDRMAGRLPEDFTLDQLIANRQIPAQPVLATPDLQAQISRRDVTIPGHNDDDIELTVYQRHDHTEQGPAVFHIHGGGMVMGTRDWGVESFLDAIIEHDLTVVTVEYRRAPEFPDPYPVLDSYQGLRWTAENAADLGIDPARVIVAGESAGGGIAAGIALMARDEDGPAILAQLLVYPMLDDRDNTISTRQYDTAGTWRRGSNRVGWTALLGERRGTANVSQYAAPARAVDYAGLPPAYIEVGSAEVFRDENVAYATALWAAGVQAELHVWAGGFHGFDGFAPDAHVSQAARDARQNWLHRTLNA